MSLKPSKYHFEIRSFMNELEKDEKFIIDEKENIENIKKIGESIYISIDFSSDAFGSVSMCNFRIYNKKGYSVDNMPIIYVPILNEKFVEEVYNKIIGFKKLVKECKYTYILLPIYDDHVYDFREIDDDDENLIYYLVDINNEIKNNDKNYMHYYLYKIIEIGINSDMAKITRCGFDKYGYD